MRSRYFAAYLFAAAAVVSLAVGFAIRMPGLPAHDYFNPLFLMFIPRLIPFAVAAVSALFALVYFGAAQWCGHAMNLPLTLVHFALFLAGVYGHARLNLYMSGALDQNGPPYPPLPVAAGVLSFLLFASILIFLLNVALAFAGRKRDPLTAGDQEKSQV